MSSDADHEGGLPETRGFSGLASLVSDVSSVVDRARGDVGDATGISTSSQPLAGSRTPGISGSSVSDDGSAGRERQETSEERPSPLTVSGGDDQDTRSSSSRMLLWIGGFAVSAVVWFAMSSGGTKDSSGPTQPVATAAAPVFREQSETPRSYAVAALNANVRAQPSTRSKVLGTLERGTPLIEIERRDGFTKFRGNDGVEKWISTDILIETADLSRLQSSSPEDYIEARKRFAPIERLTEHLGRLSPQIDSLLRQVETRQAGLLATISEIEGHERPVIDVDSAGGLWFSLSARAAADAGDHGKAIMMTTAAIFADPMKADYHTALGFSAIVLGQRELLQFAAEALPALAPGATNTWIVVGVNAALDGKKDLAHGALLAAIDRSRNRSTTLRVLRGIAARSSDAEVVAAVNEALATHEESASATGTASGN